MNRQPYATPPQRWEAKLSETFVRWTRAWRRRQLRVGQRIVGLDVRGMEKVKAAAAAGDGVLIVPNHSTHYDSAALYLAGDTVDQPLYFMTAWQVFAMSGWFDRWALQRLGCFSVDRERNDRHAFKTAIELLVSAKHPLVIFPEGDIYHVTDETTPFREGAAAIAISAAKKQARRIVVFPCAIKFRYVEDPTPELLTTLTEMEERFHLRSPRDASVVRRIYRLAEVSLALKEIDYHGATSAGPLRGRMDALMESVLSQLEARHGIPKQGTFPERVKALRQAIILKSEEMISCFREKREGKQRTKRATAEDDLVTMNRWIRDPEALAALRPLNEDLEDLFFVMQVYSYPGTYLRNEPSIERIAETIDKLEEDVLERDLPRVRGTRRVEIVIGDAIPIETSERKERGEVPALTARLHAAVQRLMDELNGVRPRSGSETPNESGLGSTTETQEHAGAS
jgi:1-acyl-sn-glycerol-3-phosphate acyltransferase